MIYNSQVRQALSWTCPSLVYDTIASAHLQRRAQIEVAKFSSLGCHVLAHNCAFSPQTNESVFWRAWRTRLSASLPPAAHFATAPCDCCVQCLFCYRYLAHNCVYPLRQATVPPNLNHDGSTDLSAATLSVPCTFAIFSSTHNCFQIENFPNR